MSDMIACQGCGAQIARTAAQRDSSGRSVCTACQSKDLSDMSDAMAFGDEMEMGRQMERQRAVKLIRVALAVVALIALVGGLIGATR